MQGSIGKNALPSGPLNEAAASKEELQGNINAVNSDLHDKFKQ